MTLSLWMRRTMLATAIMNLVGAAAFLSVASAVRALAGFPEAGHPLYMVTFGAFVFLFGAAYLWVAVKGEVDLQFLAVAAAGKLVFFALLVAFWLAGTLPARAPLAGSGDFVFGMLFLAWLLRARRAGDGPAAPSHR